MDGARRVGPDAREAQELQLVFADDLRADGRLQVGADAGVEDAVALRVIADGDVRAVLVVAVELQQRGIAGLGEVAAGADVDAALAPEVGDAEGEGQRFKGAPDLLRADADVDAEQRHAAHGGDGLGDHQPDAREHLKVPILIVLPDQHDVAVAGDGLFEHVDIDARLQVQVGVPLQTQGDAADDLDGVLDLQVGGRELDAGEAQLQLGLAVEHLDDAEGGLHGQLQRRETGGHEDRVVDVGDAAAEALQPDGAAAVDVEARLKAAHVEVDLVGDGDVVPALEAQLGLHRELFQLAGALQTEGPVADGVDLQLAADLRQAVDHVLDGEVHGEVQADEALAAAEEDVRHHDRGGHALLGLVVVLLAVVHADVRELFIAGAVVGVLIDAGAAPVGPQLLHAPEVSVRGGGVVLLRRALHKLQVQAGREADDPPILLVAVLHDAELTVSQLEDHAGQLLAVAVDVGPDQRDGVGVGVLVGAVSVLVIGDEGEVAALLQLGQRRLALPDRGARHAGVELAVKLAEDGGLGRRDLALGVILIVDGHGARLEVQAVVDGDGVVHPALAVLDRLLADGGVVGIAGDVALVVRGGVAPVADEGAAEHQQDLLILFIAVRRLLFGEPREVVLILEGHELIGERIVRGGEGAVLDRGDDAVAVVAVFRIVRDRELQDLGGLDLELRGDDVLGNGGVRPAQLHAAGADRQLHRVVQHDVGHALAEGDAGGADGEGLLAVLRGHPDLAVAGGQSVFHQLGVGHGHIEVARALVIDRLRGHGVEVDLGNASVAAGQQDVEHALAQQVLLDEVAVFRVVVDGNGDALIGGAVAQLRLEIERLFDALALLQRSIGDRHRVDAVEVQIVPELAAVAQRAQAGGAGYDQQHVLIIS